MFRFNCNDGAFIFIDIHADTRDKNNTIPARNCSVFCHRGVRPHPDAMVGFKCMLQRLHKSTIHSV